MIEGKTTSGFSYEIDDRLFKDWEVITSLDNLKKNKASMAEINNLFELLLTKDGFAELKEYVKERNDGIINSDAMLQELKEILAHEKLKN